MKLHAWELCTNQLILRFNVILQYDWSIEQCLLHIRVFFGGKTKSPYFDLFIHRLIKQLTNTYWNHFSRSYENRSKLKLKLQFGANCLWDISAVMLRWLHTNPSKSYLVPNLMKQAKFRRICMESSQHNWANISETIWPELLIFGE